MTDKIKKRIKGSRGLVAILSSSIDMSIYLSFEMTPLFVPNTSPELEKFEGEREAPDDDTQR